MTESNQAASPTVVVVGGGYGGVAVAKALDETSNVVLVEPKDAFMHNIAALRALVDPSWLPRIFLPYAGLLAHGRVVRDRAVVVDPHRVVTASGEEIPADYVVLATGSRYPFPAKTDLVDTHHARSRSAKRIEHWHGRIGSCWSERARSASSWPERYVMCGPRSRSCCSTSPTRFSAVRTWPN